MAGVPARRPISTAAAAAVAALTAAVTLSLVAAWAPAAFAEDAPGTTGPHPEQQLDEPLEGDDIIPLPNSGREPTEAGDRGGALQVLVFVLILGGVAAIAGLAVRDVRRHRAR
jgi:hypothetical protein